MNRWKPAFALMALALTASATFGQTPEQLKKELDQQKAQISALTQKMDAVIKENAELKSQQDAVQSDTLETEVNRLTERLAAATSVNSKASQITMGGEFRFRNTYTLGDSEGFNGGDGTNNGTTEHDGTYTDARVRINFLYNFTKDVSAFAELQTAWALGDNSEGPISAVEFGGNTDVNLYQGWLKVGNLFGRSEFSSKVGRQEIVLGNQFQFGNADWYDGVVFDGARWDWECTGFSLTGLALKLSSSDGSGDFDQTSAFNNSHDDDELYGLYFTLKSIKNHTIDLYWLYVNGHGGSSLNSGANAGFGNNNDLGGGGVTGFLYPGSSAYFHTLGARIGGTFDVAAGLDWNVEFAYQFGDQQFAGGELDIGAFALEAELGLTFSKDSMFRIYARFLWAEGPGDDDELGYIPLYPNRHSNGGFRARYGLADLIPMTNVVTVQLGLHFDPDPAWTLGLTALWATTDDTASGAANGFTQAATGNNILPGNGVPDEDYGWEIDVWGEYRYSDHLVFNAGVAFVFADDAAEALYGIDDDLQFYGYIQARLLF